MGTQKGGAVAPYGYTHDGGGAVVSIGLRPVRLLERGLQPHHIGLRLSASNGSDPGTPGPSSMDS